MTPGRKLVHTLGGHIARLLNKPSAETATIGDETIAVVDLDVGALHKRILKTLAGGDDDAERANSKYVLFLVAHPLYRDGASPSQAASAYFDRALDRPLALARDNHFHHGHLLLLALCRRGADPRWRSAELRRLEALPGAHKSPPLELAEVAERLSRLVQEDGQARVPKARTKHGAPFLVVDGCAVEIPERLSLWKAILAAPRRLQHLNGTRFEQFRSQVVDAVVEANGPYGRRVALGLCPTEWDDVAVNSLREISAFLSRVESRAKALGVTPDRLEVWQEIWSQRPIPRFASLEAFRSSPIGRELQRRTPQDVEPLSYDPREDQEDLDDGEAPRATQPIRLDKIDQLERDGVLDAYDGFVLRSLESGQPLEKIAKSRLTRRRFGSHAISLAYIAELSARVRGGSKS